MSPGVLGAYDANNNRLFIAEAVLNDCPPPGCNALESIISHELGHSLGFDNIEGGCESSIMSWDRNRSLVTGPSAEDICWFWGDYDPWYGDDSGCTECEDKLAVPLQVDYGDPPASWGEALGRADLVAVIQLDGLSYAEDGGRLPLTRFRATVMDVIKGRQWPLGSALTVVRFGGLQKLDGATRRVEEQRFASWSQNERLILFLSWSEELQAYALPFGPHAAFRVDPTTGTVRAFAKGRFGNHDGKAAGALLAEIRSGR